jgi:hypothetical protein
LLGAKKEITLDGLRVKKYYDKLSELCKSAVKPETLGPITIKFRSGKRT